MTFGQNNPTATLGNFQPGIGGDRQWEDDSPHAPQTVTRLHKHDPWSCRGVLTCMGREAEVWFNLLIELV